jgi:hypothetical protein
MDVTSERKMMGPMIPPRRSITVERTGEARSSITKDFRSGSRSWHTRPAMIPRMTACTIGCMRISLFAAARGEWIESRLLPGGA